MMNESVLNCRFHASICRDFRGLCIDMVLATDMSFHFQQLKNMRNLLSMPEK